MLISGSNIQMDILAFLKNEGCDFRDRRLEDVWSFEDREIEATHDFIQLVFPLEEPSSSSFHGVNLDSSDVLEIRRSEVAVTNIKRSAFWFLGFLSRSQSWRSGYDHNQLRITRAIRCLRLLVGEKEADAFRDQVFELVGVEGGLSEKTIKFWKDA